MTRNPFTQDDIPERPRRAQTELDEYADGLEEAILRIPESYLLRSRSLHFCGSWGTDCWICHMLKIRKKLLETQKGVEDAK